MPLDAEELDKLFNANERTLIAQALSDRGRQDDTEEREIIYARLRNLLTKYRELAKRERFHGGGNNESRLRIRRLEAVLAVLNPP